MATDVLVIFFILAFHRAEYADETVLEKDYLLDILIKASATLAGEANASKEHVTVVTSRTVGVFARRVTFLAGCVTFLTKILCPGREKERNKYHGLRKEWRWKEVKGGLRMEGLSE